MQKLVKISLIIITILFIFFSLNIYAVSLDNAEVNLTNTTVHPGETEVVDVEFGQNLGSYTVDISYDNNLFQYVSSEGGTADDNGIRVRVYYFDNTGGSSPRNNMKVTFKAKDVTTSNPTNFTITASGLASPDASVTYDDIPAIVKNVVVEPKYVDYNITLDYSGDIIANEEKQMTLKLSSSMGKNYEHTRIITEVTSEEEGATTKLLAIDNGIEQDIIQTGFGSTVGDPIGGKNVSKELAITGLFSKAGNYSLLFKVIDRDNSDSVIVKKTFNITVKDKEGAVSKSTKNTAKNNTKESMPSVMPQTGNTIYRYLIPILFSLIVVYFVIKKSI